MTKTIYKGKVVTLNLETVTLPNQATVQLEVVRHPGAAAIVPMKENGTVVLIRQYRHAAGGYIYEIPAGTLRPGEDPHACATRELEEEVGYRATALELLVKIYTAPGFADEVIHIFKGTGLTPGRQHLDRDEVLEVVELPLDKAIAQIQESTIRDGKTIVGLQAVFLQQRAS